MPRDNAPSRLRHAAHSTRSQIAPLDKTEQLEVAFSREKRDAWKQAQVLRAESMQGAAAVIEYTTRREQRLRQETASDLRNGLGWDLVLIGLGLVVTVGSAAL